MSAPDPDPKGAARNWLAFEFDFTRFSSKVTRSPQQRHSTTLPALARIIETEHREADGATPEQALENAKHLCPMLKLCLFGNKATEIRRTPDGKSTGGSYRSDGNVMAVTGVEADYDGGQISFEDARAWLNQARVAGVLYTSARHTPEFPRWRFLSPFSRVVVGQQSGEAYDRLKPRRDRYMNRLNGVFRDFDPPKYEKTGIFGPESWTLSQGFFYGLCNNSPYHQVVVIDGVPLDLLDHLDLTAIVRPGTTPKLAKMRPGFQAHPNPPDPGDPEADVRTVLDESEAERQVVEGVSIHPNLIALIGKWFHDGKDVEDIWGRAEALLDRCSDELKSTSRWAERRASIPDVVATIVGKEVYKKAQKRRQRAEREANADAAREREAAAQPQRPLPVIEVFAGLRHQAADQGLQALVQAGVEFFCRSYELVRVVPSKAKDSRGREVKIAGVKPVATAMMGRVLGKHARWERFDARAQEMRRIDPPDKVVDQALGMSGEWPFSTFRGLIGTQTMRPDGSILSKSGYDPATGFYVYQPPSMAPIKDRPTKRDAEAGLELLAGLLTEFPFVDSASRSVAVSMIMTTVLRAALGDAVPMHLIDAPAPGTGKSYLMDIAAAIATGQRCPVIAVPPNDANELEKRLNSAALSARLIIAIDNCNGVLKGDFLAQVTQASLMALRPLGGSPDVIVPNTFTVFANGNNIVVVDDIVRRTVRARLDTNLVDPTDREFLRDPVETILANRGAYINAVLTIARAYHCAGYPGAPTAVLGFADWTRMVAGSLMWLGWESPTTTTKELKAEDPSRHNLVEIIDAFPTAQPAYSAKDLIAMANEYRWDEFAYPAWREAITPICANSRGELDLNRLGAWLGRHRAQATAGGKLNRVGNPPRYKWTVLRE